MAHDASADSTPSATGLSRADLTKAQFGWSLYDVANSAFSTTLVAAIAGPYLLAITNAAAATDAAGNKTALVFGFSVAPGAFVAYLTTASIVLQILLLPIVGAIVDATGDKRRWIKVMAFAGSALVALLAFLPADLWLVAGITYAVANVAFGMSLVPYNAMLADISDEHERDRVSARGFAYGYGGGGLLLAVNLAFLQLAPSALGISRDLAVRIDIATVAVWWTVFTVVAIRMLNRVLPPPVRTATIRQALGNSGRDLKRSLKDLLRYRHAASFLGAFLLFNDGISGVIALAGVFVIQELFIANGIPESEGISFVIILVLIIQFCAVPGALLFARLAGRIGSKRALLVSLCIWILVVAYTFAALQNKAQAIGIAVAIALVLGGSQALARSMFTLMIPAGRENSWLALLQVADRGTSFVAPLLFGLALTVTGSYRAGLAALLLLFVSGTLLLLVTDTDQAIADAKSTDPVGRVPSGSGDG